MNRYFKIFVLIIIGILFSFSGCKNDKDVTGVTISPSICVLRVNETLHLTATVSPDNADNKSVSWTIQTLEPKEIINAQNVASISESGKVTGLAEGFALATCITNQMFYEATATIMVGYATAVVGMYNGSLLKNDELMNTSTKIGISYISEYAATEYEAAFGLPFLNSTTPWCPVTVDYKSEKMEFSGETTIDLDGVTTPVKVSGVVALYGLGEFEILVGSNTKYSFSGQKEPRKPNY